MGKPTLHFELAEYMPDRAFSSTSLEISVATISIRQFETRSAISLSDIASEYGS